MRHSPPLWGTSGELAAYRTEVEVRHAELHRPIPLRAAPIPDVAGVHRRGRAHSGFGHRRHHGHLHADPRRHAPLASRLRSRTALPHRRRRRLLRRGQPAGPLGNVFFFAVRAAEDGDAGIRRVGRVSGRPTALECPASRRRSRCPAFALRIRHRKLFFDAGSARIRRAHVHCERRYARGSAGGRAEPPRLAGVLRRRSGSRGLELRTSKVIPSR